MDLFPFDVRIAPVVVAAAGLLLIVVTILRARGKLSGRFGWFPTALLALVFCWGLVGVARIDNPLVRFGNPAALMLLALVPYFWICGKKLRPIGKVRRLIAVSLRLAVVILLVLALAQMQRVRENDELSVYYLLDASKSVSPQERQEVLTLINEASERMTRKDRAGMIVFGGNASIEDMPRLDFQKNEIESAPDADATDIGSAIQLAAAAFPENTMRRIVLLSDMNENRGSVLEEIRSARSNQIAIDLYPLGTAERKEVLVDKIVVPTEVKEDETFDVSIYLESTHDEMPVAVRLYRNEQLIAENPNYVVQQGKSALQFNQTLQESGFHEYRVEIESPEDDNAENNRGYSFTYVSGTPTVLYVRSDPVHDRFLPQSLQEENINVEVVSSAGIPTNLADFQSYDSIILSNIHAGDMTQDQMKMFETAVRDFGVGLVMIGGDQSYGVGGYNGSPVERALPVEMEIKQKKVIPSGALVMVMHSVEIPQGQSIAQEIAMAAVEVLGEGDKVGILLYDWGGPSQQSGERWLWNPALLEARYKSEMLSKIMGMTNGDMPTFDPTLKMAYTELLNANANKKHIVILSDGDPSPPNQALIRQIAAAQISISTILIYPHTSGAQQLMKGLADATNGNYHFISSPANLPQIFIKEASIVRKSLIFEGPSDPDIVQYSDSITGFQPGELPQLYGYVATTAKDRAEVPINSKDEYPILAQWRYGLGRTVAFTSDAKNQWARDWVGWDKYNKFWSQIVRWSMRSIEKGNLRVTTEIRDGVGHVVIDAIGDDREYANYLNFDAIVADPDIETHGLEIRQTQPGRYEGTFPASKVGNYLLNLQYEDAEGNMRAYQAGTSLSYSSEYRDTEPNYRLLTQAQEAAGGNVLRDFSGVFLHNIERTRAFHPLWPAVLMAALLLLPLDIFVRRVMIDRQQLAAAGQRVLAFVPFLGRRREVSKDAGMERLLGVKERVKAQRVERTSGKPREQTTAAFLSEKVKDRPRTTVLSGGKKDDDVSFEEPKVGRPQQKGGPTGESPFTQRLLEAKKRARERQRKEEDE